MLRAFLLVGLGGAAGSMARYAINLLIRQKPMGFPWATFAVNLAGCFLIGLLIGFVHKQQTTSNDLLLILGTGFCGGFTTFSTFAYENANLFSKQYSTTAIVYALLSLVLGIALCRAGFLAVEKL